jgi:hypothetical protein
MIAAIAFAVAPVQAGNGDGKAKKKGGINPTNVVVVESDFDTLAATTTESDDPGTYLWADPSTEDTLAVKTEEPADDAHLADVPVTDDRIQAAAAHEVATGQGVVVAILDGGFNLHHSAIVANVSPFGFDAIDLDDDPNDFGDGFEDDGDGIVDGAVGHGTFVAGMVLKAAPDATILPIRVRDDEGFGTNEELIRGIDYAIAMGVDVMNLSLSDAQAKKQGITRAMNNARDAGIVVVISAGNDGFDYVPKLACNWGMICVGAVNAEDRITDFSNYTLSDAWLMIFADGEDLHGPVGAPDDDSMGHWSGTSFSAGTISGAASLVRERHPDYDPLMVGDTLRQAVDPVWDRDRNPVPGVGRINLHKAVLQ